MKKNFIKALLFGFLLLFTSIASAETETIKNNLAVKGIYVTQYNFENTPFLNHLVKHAKASGIDTFVVDMEIPSKRYQQNVAILKENNIKYVARVTMFPDGGTAAQIADQKYWEKKYALVQQAVNYGAQEIQLDYIRYKAKQAPSAENSKNVYKVIEWFKTKLAAQNIPLQVDVFGIASYRESKSIGQSIPLFANTVDAVCPMVYPSHFTPFREHFETPHETIYDALTSVKDQFDGKMPVKLYAYIELSNYHYAMSHAQTLDYIKDQITAVEEAGADGWYAWSPHNRYDNLFSILENKVVHQD